MIDKVLFPRYVTGKATHPVIDADQVGLEAVNQIVKGLEWRNAPTGRYVDIDSEGADAMIRMTVWVGVDGDMALVEMADHRIGQRAGRFGVGNALRGDGFLRNQHGDTGTAWFVVLAGDIQDIGADDFGDLLQNPGQPLGVVSFIKIGDVALLLFRGRGIANIIAVKAEGLGEVVKPLQLQSGHGYRERLGEFCAAAGILVIFRSALLMLTVKLTEYYRSLIDWSDPDDPLARMTLFAEEEIGQTSPEDPEPTVDPPQGNPVSRVLIHRYPDRALLLTTSRCAAHCRYCFRKDRIERHEADLDDAELAEAVAYVAAHSSIREIILSGGDPLALPNARLLEIINAFRRIPHLGSVRVHTRFPVYQPARCNTLAEVAKQVDVFVVQVNHAREVTAQFVQAMAWLRPHALLYNQGVLLHGVNDNVATLSELSWALARAGVTPYCLHYPDQVPGTAHFRLPLAQAITLVGALRGRLPGYLLPRLILEIPDGSGKIALEPSACQQLDEQTFLLRSPLTGQVFEYREAADFEPPRCFAPHFLDQGGEKEVAEISLPEFQRCE
jgi:lysine 2,3-aminomutase